MRTAFAHVLVAGLTLATSGCSSPTEVTPPPPPVNNAPPTIASLTPSAPRVEAGENVVVTAVVQDAETPVDQLQYDWSASPVSGSFSGTGSQVSWKAPFLQAPGLVSLTLRVTENYSSNGTPKQNSVSSSVQVHYNDSYQDVNKISMRFLTELFPTYSVTPEQAVQDFSDSTVRQVDGTKCSDGKASELSDIRNNRVNFHIWSGSYTGVRIELNFDRTFADVAGTCVFEDTPTNPSNPNYGKRERITGICHLTAVYENWNWFLCQSHFIGTGVTPLELRYRVPGRIVSQAEAARWRR
jgi:hypothetical protein